MPEARVRLMRLALLIIALAGPAAHQVTAQLLRRWGGFLSQAHARATTLGCGGDLVGAGE